MGWLGSLVLMNRYSKKQCRSFFWRVRAAAKKAAKNGGKRQLKFGYDASSYALNFDEGGCDFGGRGRANALLLLQGAKLEEFSESTIWVYVLWVK